MASWMMDGQFRIEAATEDEAQRALHALERAAGRVAASVTIHVHGSEAGEDRPCGRIMVGSGDDTYDPVCELPSGHAGSCKSSAALDQHWIASTGEDT